MSKTKNVKYEHDPVSKASSTQITVKTKEIVENEQTATISLKDLKSQKTSIENAITAEQNRITEFTNQLNTSIAIKQKQIDDIDLMISEAETLGVVEE